MPLTSAYQPLGVLAQPVRDAVLPAQTDARVYVALEHVGSGDIIIRRSGRADDARSSKFAFKPGDVLYGKLRPYLDKAVLADFAGVASTEFIVLRANDGVDPAFLAFTLHSARVLEHARATTAGVNHPRTSWDALSKLEVYAPTLDEQRRTAQMLSTLQSALDAAAVKRRRILQVLDSLRIYLFGKVEVDSDKMPLRAVLREPLRNGYSPPAALGGTIRVLTLSAVTNDEFSDKNTKLASANGRRIEDLWLRPGDVFIERANTRELVGSAARYSGSTGWAIFPDLLIRVRPDESIIDSRILIEYLRLPQVRQYFSSRARGTAGSMPKIDHEMVNSLPIAVPKTDTQSKLISAFQVLRGSARAEASVEARLQTLFDASMATLLHGEV